MNRDFSVHTLRIVEQLLNPLPSEFRIYGTCLADEIMDLNAITEGSSLVPFKVQPLRSNATYPLGDDTSQMYL
jgi:hypothetical protein